jgi:CheY-like chemotaxis protein
LIVEDNPGDVRLMQEAFQETGRPHQATVARDGIEALDHL